MTPGAFTDGGAPFGCQTETIAAANREMNDSLKAALGPDRFLDYLRAISETGQKMRNFAARFELPRQTLARAVELQCAIDNVGRPGRASYDLSRFPRVPPPERDIGELQAELEQTLGPQLSQAWREGRNLRVRLDP